MHKHLQELKGWHKTAAETSVLQDCVLIVPTCRRPVEMVRLLGVIATLEDAPAEVVIVDGSPDNRVDCAVRQWADERDLPFDLIFVKSPPGLTRQRNVGLDACSREFIFFLDDDCLPEPGYFDAIHRAFLEDRQCRVGAIRGFITNGIGKPITLLWRIRFSLAIVPRGEPGHYHPCGTSGTWDSVAPFKGTRKVHVLAGGVSAYRREVFAKHRFSEFFYGYAQGEDFEMALRIGKEWDLLVCGDAHVDHRHAESGRPAGFARGRMAARNRYFIWKRHSPAPGLLNRARFVGDHLLMVAYYGASFVLRPWKLYPLAFAAGTAIGILEWITSPPTHTEPLARKEYSFDLEPLNRVFANQLA